VASRIGAATSVVRRARPSRRTRASPARSSTRTCFETAGNDIAKREASSLMVRSPSASRAMMARRVGSASAAKVASSGA
jgi:hypothetical protein